MSLDIPESDWRRFREVHKTLLERFCGRVLHDLAAVSHATDGTAHQRYLRAYKLLEKRDEEMAHAFDDIRRSTAIMQLGIMRRMGLLTDEDMSLFSEPTQARVRTIASL
jgi:hypothetical protein